MARKEFSSATRKAALKRSGLRCEAAGRKATRQNAYRAQFEAGGGKPRSKSANFRWIEAVVLGPWPRDCVEWPFAKRGNGYGTIIWKYQRTTAHRVACELAHGPTPETGMQAAHSCGNRACCNPAHLRWATAAENHADKIGHGTLLSGERCPASKLTAEQVRSIRMCLLGGMSLPAIGEKFNVSASTVWMISAGKTWRGISL